MTNQNLDPQFKPGDRVRVAKDARRADGYVASALKRLCSRPNPVGVIRDLMDQDGDYIVTDPDEQTGDNWAYVAGEYLSPAEPAPVEPTDEQRAAWHWLERNAPANADMIAPLLPDALTNPRPALPTEPGWYQGFDKVAQSQVTIRLADNGNWGHGITGSAILANPERFAPFTRLIPERPQVTEDEVTPPLGMLPNARSGQRHIHSGKYECGIAYRWGVAWLPCGKLVNHDGDCGYKDNSAY